MSLQPKILVNKTGTDIPLKFVGGESVPANGEKAIRVTEYLDYAIEDSINELITHIVTNGDINVKDGITEMSGQEALNYLLYPHFAKSSRFEINTLLGHKQFTQKTTQQAVEESFPSIKKDATLIQNTVRNIIFEGAGVIVTNEGNNTVKVNHPAEFIPGKLVDFSFGNVGNTQNKWLEFATSSASSDEDPFVAVFGGILVGLTYVNTRDNTDLNIEIYKNGSIWFTWEIRNKRYAFKTNFDSPEPTLLQGDRISMFSKKITSGSGSSQPSTPIVEFTLQVTSSPIAEGGGQNGV